MNPILVPVDFSPGTATVVTEALRYARRTGAPLTLMHAVLPPVFAPKHPGTLADDVTEMLQRAAAEADRQLELLRRRLREPVNVVPTVIAPPVNAIVDTAQRLGASLVVLGSHGHGPLYDLAMGSTCRAVLRNAPCPVLVVPMRTTGKPGRRPARPAPERLRRVRAA